MTRLVHISDLHFGAHDPALVEQFVALSTDLRPDAVVISGDFTQGGRRSEFEAARRFIERLPAPVVVARGNHDAPAWAWHERVIHPWRRMQDTVGTVSAEAWEGARAVVESFSTSPRAQFRLDWSLGQVRRRSLHGALQRLGEADGDKAAVLTCHHPLLAPVGAGRRARTRGAKASLEHVTRRVDLVLSGHLHQAYAVPWPRRDGRTSWFIGASTAFSHRTREEPAGFNVVTIEENIAQLDVFTATEASDFALSGERALHLTEPQSLVFKGPRLTVSPGS
jgi:3',5'-cyclic AMP phosphodiesterase CpdA